MKKLSLLSYLLLLAMSTLMLTSCGDDDGTDPEPEPELLNIIEWATEQGDYTLLLAAAEKAGLTELLSDPTVSYTIFGPKDETFQAFLDVAAGGSLDNVDSLTAGAILSGHALLGQAKSDELVTGYVVSRGGLALSPDFTASMFINTDGGVAINGGTATTGGATVIEADLQASNGVIHVIDNVIAPPKIPTFIASDPDFSTTLAAISRDDLGIDFAAAAGGDDPLTVFAPSNAAWDAFLTAGGYASVADVPAAALAVALGKHIINGNTRSGDITDGMMAPNLAAGMITLNVANGTVTVNAGGATSATVTTADIQGHNGVIHKIDAILD